MQFLKDVILAYNQLFKGVSSMLIHIRPKNQPPLELSLEDVNSMLQKSELDGDEPAWTVGLEDWTILSIISGVSMPMPPPLLTEHTEETDPSSKADITSKSIEPDSEQTPEIPSNNIIGPKGVGGWLMFFGLGLVILGPLFNFGKMNSSWEQSKPAFDSFPTIRAALVVENIGIVVITIAGIFVGLKILSGNLAGRRLAKIYLKGRLIGFIAVEFIAFLLMSNLPSEIMPMLIGNFIGVIIAEAVLFTIWWLYFKRSKRVRNTYGPIIPGN